MARIGTWTEQKKQRSDFYLYTSKGGLRVAVFLTLDGRGHWGVETGKTYDSHFDYLAGGDKPKVSKSKAFELAREYMRKHP